MKTEDLLSCPPEPESGPYPKQDESSTHYTSRSFVLAVYVSVSHVVFTRDSLIKVLYIHERLLCTYFI